MSASRYYARRPIPGYGGQELDQGQILTLGGFRNDEQLVRLGYLQPFGGSETYACRLCGRHFVDQRSRQQHGDYRHVERALTPAQQDDREERRLADAPAPFLDQTAASRGASPPEITSPAQQPAARAKRPAKRPARKEA
jgi:hypothetical protein